MDFKAVKYIGEWGALVSSVFLISSKAVAQVCGFNLEDFHCLV